MELQARVQWDVLRITMMEIVLIVTMIVVVMVMMMVMLMAV